MTDQDLQHNVSKLHWLRASANSFPVCKPHDTVFVMGAVEPATTVPA